MSEPVGMVIRAGSFSAPESIRWESGYRPKVGDHFYTADAIREAVERERQEIILVLKDELFSEEEVLFVKGYNGGIRNALEVIKARGAA
jgi:hypothetical protein